MRIFFKTISLFLWASFICAQVNKTIANDKSPVWSLIKSTSHETYYYLKMFSSNSGFMGGKNLFKYENNKLSPSQIVDPIGTVDQIKFFSPNNIWCTTINNAFESVLFHYDGKSWTKKYHPLANRITALHINQNGVGWYSGFREIAYCSGSKYNFIPYPHNFTVVKYIFGNTQNQVWIQTLDGKLFFFNGISWIQHLITSAVTFAYFSDITHGFAISGEKLFEFNKQNWKIHSSSNLLTGIEKLFFLNSSEIFGVGREGAIIHFKNGVWRKMDSPTKENLIDLQMLSETEGWAVGVNGIVLHYSKNKSIYEPSIKFPLSIIRLMSIETEINDEYGVAVDDINGDGLKDIYTVCIYKPNRLFINRSTYNEIGKILTLSFEDEATDRKISGITGERNKISVNKTQIGVGLADIDNDSDTDLYITNLSGNNLIFLNDGKGNFRNVSNENDRGTNFPGRWNAVIFGDVDNDGDLDLFITNEESSNKLLLNDGNGYFHDVTKSAGLVTNGGGMGAAFGDIDGDGKLDLYVANWAMPNLLYKNVSTKSSGVKFIEIAKEAGVQGEGYTKSNAAVFADYDNDGDLDLFVTNRKRSNILYKNNGKGIFEDVTGEVIGKDSLASYGASFADFDQDGYLDLFVANVGENVLYKNIKGEKFVETDFQIGNSTNTYNTGTACGDIDNDGDVDIYVCNYVNGESKLYINELNRNNFISIKLEGTRSNRDAVGAKIWLYKCGHINEGKYLLGYREVNSGSGYMSHNSKEIHFGTGEEKFFDLVVEFPTTKIRKTLKLVPAGSHLIISEEDSFEKVLTLSQKYFQRFFADPGQNKEIPKFTVLSFLVACSVYWGRKRYKWSLQNQFVFHAFVGAGYFLLIYFFIYERFLLSVLLPFSFVIISLAILHLIYERVIMVKLAKVERQAARDRIARDLHDDLASTLSSSVIYTEVLRNSLANIPQPHNELLDKIKNLLNEASTSVTDIIWTASPSHDKLDDLIFRLKIMVADMCKTNHIEYHLDINEDNYKISIKEELRRNIFLIFKESLTNTIKHACATDVILRSNFTDDFLVLELEDNGCGFEITKEPFLGSEHSINVLHGNGLKNIMRRAKEINAELKIDSLKNAGTKTILKVKMT